MRERRSRSKVQAPWTTCSRLYSSVFAALAIARVLVPLPIRGCSRALRAGHAPIDTAAAARDPFTQENVEKAKDKEDEVEKNRMMDPDEVKTMKEDMKRAKALVKSLGKRKVSKTIDLSLRRLSDVSVQFLAQVLPNCIRLERLILSKNKIGVVGAEALARALPDCKSLKGLWLRRNQLGPAGAQMLATVLPTCKQLKTLDLWRNHIGNDGAQALAQVLPFCENLERINIGRNHIGHAGVEALAQVLPRCSHLNSLCLGDNRLGDAGAQALAKVLPECTHIEFLDLGSNSLGDAADAGAQALAMALPKCQHLRELILRDNRIGNSGANALAQVLVTCKNLERLDLGSNQIGEVGAEKLAKALPSCKKLLFFNLGSNLIGSACAEELERMLQSSTQLKLYNLRQHCAELGMQNPDSKQSLDLISWAACQDEEGWTIEVPLNIETRLSDALHLALPTLFRSRTAAKRACRKGGVYRISVDGTPGRSDVSLRPGQVVRIDRTEPVINMVDVVFADDSMLVVWKPAGLTVYGGARSLKAHLSKLGYSDAAPIHRLDVPTEGLLVCGRTVEARRDLASQFKNRQVCKRYCAVLHGHAHEEGNISAPIDGKEALTRWRLRWKDSSKWGPISCVDLWPETGRRHQLRRHCAEVLNMTILGDIRYESGPFLPLHLSAVGLVLHHPVDKRRLEFDLPEPSRFAEIRLLQTTEQQEEGN